MKKKKKSVFLFQSCQDISEGLLAQGTPVSFRVSPDDRRKAKSGLLLSKLVGDAWCLGSLRGPAPSHTILSKAGSVQ